MSRHVDWIKVREAYIASRENKSEVAVRFKVSRETLSRRATAERWDELRSQHQHVVVTEARAMGATEEARRLMDECRLIRERDMAVARGLISKAIEALKALNPESMTPSELARFVTAAAQLQNGSADSARKTLELLAKITGELDPRPRIDIGLKFDVSILTDEQLRRIAAGEDPALVLNHIRVDR